MALILTGTSTPAIVVPGAPANADKGAHFLMYAPLGALLVKAWGASDNSRWRVLARAFLTGCLFAACDEWHQRFIPTRSCEFNDWLADLTGICTGCIIAALLWRSPRKDASSTMAPKDLKQEDFADELAAPGVLVVDFWMNGCGHCAHYAPIFEQLAQELSEQARFCKVEARDNMDLSREHQIRGVPTTVVFKDGQEVQRTTGAKTSEEMKAWLAPLL